MFEEVELRLLRQISREGGEDPSSKERAYERVGFFAQAAGALTTGMYLYVASLERDFDEKLTVHSALIVCAFFTLAAFLISNLLRTPTASRLMAAAEAEEVAIARPLPRRGLLRPRLHAFAEGLALGCVSVPFVVYYFEHRLDYYYDHIGLLLAAFFLLKGIGREAIRRVLAGADPLEGSSALRFAAALSNAALVAMAVWPSAAVSAACLLVAVPCWHYGRVRLQRSAEAAGVSAVWGELCMWERVGTAAGVLLGAYSFWILYFRPYFGYAFALCAIIRQVNAYFMEREELFDNFKEASSAINE